MTSESSKVTAKVEQMDRSLTESSSAIEEMAANIRSVADRAKSNDEAGDVLAKTMDHGNEVVLKLQGIVRANAETSHQIQDMIKVIMQIAAQTNLLAMNAAIEAAHAGDAGRGFAVVAEEIRKLADQSAGSAKQIQTTVKRIAEGFGSILQSTEATGQEFTVLKGEIERVRQGSREIALAMAEQQTANDSVLESIALLTRLSAEARSSIQAQFRSTEAVSQGVQAVADLSLQVARATEEESTALDETAHLGEDVQQLARELNQVTEKVQAAFRSFKTQETGESLSD
jgi:methyl-accepting chemotaxis protein